MNLLCLQELLDLRHKLEQDSKRLAKIFNFIFDLLVFFVLHCRLAKICFDFLYFFFFSLGWQRSVFNFRVFLLRFRLAEICAAIEEMERRQREAELRRLKAQNQEWIKDFKPEGAAEFGSMPSFR